MFLFFPRCTNQVKNWTLQQISSLSVYGDKVTLQFSDKFALKCDTFSRVRVNVYHHPLTAMSIFSPVFCGILDLISVRFH